MTPNIDIRPNYVIIEGIRIERPTRLSPSQWLRFWEEKEAEEE